MPAAMGVPRIMRQFAEHKYKDNNNQNFISDSLRMYFRRLKPDLPGHVSYENLTPRSARWFSKGVN